MADLEFSYELLEELINTFGSVKENLSVDGSSTAGSVDSDDPVALHHGDAVTTQESQLMFAVVSALGNAHEGARAVYDDFKDADLAGGE